MHNAHQGSGTQGGFKNCVRAEVRHSRSANTTNHQCTRQFRERNGWCPYSERVWLALEVSNVAYDTVISDRAEHHGLEAAVGRANISTTPLAQVLIDNMGEGRPAYFSGSTPKMRWPDGRAQGESMDLVKVGAQHICGQRPSGQPTSPHPHPNPTRQWQRPTIRRALSSIRRVWTWTGSYPSFLAASLLGRALRRALPFSSHRAAGRSQEQHSRPH